MNILHITGLHFGSTLWIGNDKLLLDKINSFDADLILNSGDTTTDSLESEYTTFDLDNN